MHFEALCIATLSFKETSEIAQANCPTECFEEITKLQQYEKGKRVMKCTEAFSQFMYDDVN